MTDDEKFETHIKSTAWYGVLSQAANDDDDGASVFRMARMAAREAWNAALAQRPKEQASTERLDASRYRFIRDDNDWHQNDRYWEAISAGGEKLDKTIDDGIKSRTESEDDE